MKYTRVLALGLSIALLCGCGGRKNVKPIAQTKLEVAPVETQEFTFQAQPSGMVTLSEEGAAAVLDAVAQTQAEYPYAELYDLEQAEERLRFDAHVEEHQYNARNTQGELDAQHLLQLVKDNNAAYLEQTEEFDLKEFDDEDLLSLCRTIVDTVAQMEEKHPDIDWKRVECNLGNLKIFDDAGNLSYAQVTDEMVLEISENNRVIQEMQHGEEGFAKTMVHEIMHMIQMGCSCEEIGNCRRRAGICVSWEDLTWSPTDWTWLLEASAERNMAALTESAPITYLYRIDYMCSMNLSVLLRETVQPDTMQLLCFQSDPQKLFDAFGAQTPQQREQVINMMTTIEVLQVQPWAFYEKMVEAGYDDPRTEDGVEENFSYSLKTAPCITMTGEFYENLTEFLLGKQVPANDVLFLINLFEGQLNRHLLFDRQERMQFNGPVIEYAAALRDALLTALEHEDGADLLQMYADYEIGGENGALNGELSMLPAEKRSFLAELARRQEAGLGTKAMVQ